MPVTMRDLPADIRSKVNAVRLWTEDTAKRHLLDWAMITSWVMNGHTPPPGNFLRLAFEDAPLEAWQDTCQRKQWRRPGAIGAAQRITSAEDERRRYMAFLEQLPSRLPASALSDWESWPGLINHASSVAASDEDKAPLISQGRLTGLTRKLANEVQEIEAIVVRACRRLDLPSGEVRNFIMDGRMPPEGSYFLLALENAPTKAWQARIDEAQATGASVPARLSYFGAAERLPQLYESLTKTLVEQTCPEMIAKPAEWPGLIEAARRISRKQKEAA